jgi:hypothetical protein
MGREYLPNKTRSTVSGVRREMIATDGATIHACPDVANQSGRDGAAVSTLRLP